MKALKSNNPVESKTLASVLTADSLQVFLKIEQTVSLSFKAQAFKCTVSEIIEMAKEEFQPEHCVCRFDRYCDHDQKWSDETFQMSLLQELDFALEILCAQSFNSVSEAAAYLINKGPRGYPEAFKALELLEDEA